jgi:putative transposase
MCGWLEVSRSGFYEWQDRPLSATAQRREDRKVEIAQIFADPDETYGYRRIHAELARKGTRTCLELVRGLMHQMGLVACQPRPWRLSSTASGTDAHNIADLLARDFTATLIHAGFYGGSVHWIPTGWLVSGW